MTSKPPLFPALNQASTQQAALPLGRPRRPDSRPLFGAADVIPIASKLTVDDGAFIIGGQATNLWAWFFREHEPELRVPLTSADIDYFGPYEAAEKFAAAVGGRVLRRVANSSRHCDADVNTAAHEPGLGPIEIGK